MNTDKKRVYILTTVMLAVLLTSLFVDIGSNIIVTACLLLPLTTATLILIKKKAIPSISKKEVTLLLTVIAVLTVVLLQLSGIYFGFYQPLYVFSSYTFFNYILPFTVIIVAVEIIRSRLLAQKYKFSSVMCYLICVLSEVLMYRNLHEITSLNRFMGLVGLTLFPALTGNVLYHYVSKKFGAVPNIIFRLIITLYAYVLPITSGISDSLLSFIWLILPLVIFFFVRAIYRKGKKSPKEKNGKFSYISMGATAVLMLSIVMIISCQFTIGALVIATESMTGEINKGDVIIFEKYDDQKIKENQVIVFRSDTSMIVHRVIKIETIGDERRYFTKGDANDSPDAGYVLEADIVGLTDFKIPYIGFPTLWLNEIIRK